MNKIYAVVWNRARCAWVVVSELASAIGRPASAPRRRQQSTGGLVLAAMPLFAALSLPRLALAQTVLGPTTTPITLTDSSNYQVNSGVTISSTGSYVNTIAITGIAPFTFTNSGMVKGANEGGGSAIYTSVDGTVINQASGAIWGTTWGIHFSGNFANGNVINHGDISARVSHPIAWEGSAGGTFDNYGTINAGTAGTVQTSPNGATLQSSGLVTINNHAGATIKSGTTDGTWGDGISLYGSGALHLNNEGLIQGYHSVINNEGSSAIELYNKAGGQLISTLEAALLIQSNSTIRNAGSISSPVGAISFLGSNNTLVLESTSSISGNVLGGANGTLALGGSTAGSFDMGQLGPTVQYRSFSLFDKIETGTWTLTGTSNANWKVSNGTLILADGGVLNSSSLTILPGGTFQFGKGGTGSVFAGSFINNGSLLFNQAGPTSLTSVISGTGAVVIRDKEVLSYLANNTYTGTTTIDSGGSLRVGGGGASGAVVGDIIDNGELVFNRSDSTVYAGSISGTGTFSHMGTGALTLTGTNTHTGGSTIATGGTLHVGAGGESGSISGDIVNNGTLIADRSGSLEFDGVISGTGTLVKRGLGILRLSGDNTYGGATRLEAGILAATSANNFGALGNSLFFDGGSLRWLSSFFIDRPAELLTGGGSLDSNGSNVEWRGLTSGVGHLTKTGQGTVFLTADNTYTGGTSVLGGNLQLGNGGSTGSVLGDIANDASLTFNRSDAVTFANLVSGTGSVTQSGPGLLTFTANHSYTGGTLITGGSLQLGDGGTTGRVAGNVVNNGQLLVNRSDNVTDVAGLISGSGSFTKLGSGTLTITRNQLYTGATTISEGTLRIGNGGASGGIRGNIINNATLIHDRSDAITFSSSLSGTGTFLKSGSGTLRMTASNPFTGSTQLNSGLTLVDGSLDGSVQVNNGATLGGVGIVGGPVSIANGGHLSPGDSPGTLRVDSLVLNSSSQLDYELGVPNVFGQDVNDLTEVDGDLTLDGVLNITDVGGFGNGVYRLFTYGGTLTDNGLLFGTLPLGFANSDLLLQTSVVSVVSLIVSQGGLSVQFWDGPNINGNGVINGGTSTWNTLTSRWTNGAGDVNAPWQNGFAVFQGTAGTVTLGENIATTGLQFLTSGYVINGGAFNLHSDANNFPIRVDAGVTATVNAAIHDGSAGATKLIKRDAGTLVLAGPNSYTGGTVVESGTLQVGSDTNLGAAAGGVELDNAGLTTNSSFTTTRSLLLGSGLSVLTPATGTTLTWNGAISGEGGLDKQGTGTLILGADNTYTGNTRLTGTLQLGNGGSSGSVRGNIVNNGALVVDRSNAITLDGILSGSGSLTQQGTGTTTLTGINTYAGGTALNGGVLVAATDTRLGAAAGALSFDGGTLRTGAAFDSARSVTLNAGGGTLEDANGATFRGVFSGSGGLTKSGVGKTVLTADNTYTGGTTITAGTLQVGDGGTSGSLLGNISNNGALMFDRSDASSFNGVISGSGEVTVIGGGTLTLGGVNTYSHANGTQVREGSTLIIGSDANLGAASNRVLLRNDSTLRLTNSFTLGRAFVLEGAGTHNHIDILGNTITLTGNISGESGLQKDGSGSLILTGANSYTGGTTIAAGTLQIGNGGASGSLLGNVINNGALVFNRSGSLSLDGLISGTGSLTQAGPGTLVLTGANSYSGGTFISGGTLQLGAGGTSGSVLGNISNNGALVFNRGDSLSYAGVISGSGSLNKQGAGALTLSGANTFTGATTVSSGRLLVTGSLAGLVQVNSGATLGGTGSIGDGVTIGDGGTLAPGTSPGTLSVDSLVLNSDAILEYELGLPNIVGGGVNDLVSVAGNLVMDGHLNIINVGAFGNGVYRLFDYGGTLTDNGLLFGSLPAGFTAADLVVQTSIANQVNLLVSVGGFGLQFWDGPNLSPNGVIDGGSGVWNTTTPRWTNGAGDANTDWLGNFAVFQGAAGTVTLGQDIGFTGAQFRTSGYVLDGGGFSLQGNAADTVLRVDAGVSATVNAALRDGSAGAVRLVKTDAGTLIVGAANTHTGGTAIEGGRLQVGADAAFGAAGTGISLNAGVLATSNSFGNTRALVLGVDGGAIAPAAGTLLGLGGVISGAGMLDKQDAGTLVFSGDVNTYSGGTRLSGGVLAISLLGHLGNTGSGLTFDGGTLRLDASFNLAATRLITLEAGGGTIDTNGNTSVLSQAMHGSGTFTKAGAGTLTLADNQLYAGLTTVAAGTLRIGTGGTTGSLLGAVVDNGTLVFARSDVLGYDQVISGSGNVIQQGPGRLVWTADHSYTGGTVIAGGTLQLGSNSAAGSVLGNIVNNGALIFARSNAVSYAGTISGSGSLTQQGPGALTLTANHSYTGGTTVNSGASLNLGTGGASGMVVGNITNNGSLSVNRSDNVSMSGDITGTGSLTKLGAGELQLLGNVSQTGTTTLSAGSLRIGDGGTAGSLAGDIINNGALIFQRGNSYTQGSTISGTGSLEQRGAGVLILPRANTYTGGTLISAGTLQIGNGTSGSVVGNITNNGALNFNRDGNLTYAGVISGSGTLSQIGAGTLTLSGANTMTGLTRVNTGQLHVDGSLAGDVQVNSGATLGGVGSVGGLVTVAGGGIVAPGNSAGTLTFDSLLLNDSSQLEFELGVPNVVGGTANDLISVGGNLTLDGQLNLVNLGGFSDGVYRLFNYGGTLTNNGLLFGALPSGTVAGDLLLQTNVANQVNLIVSQGGLGLQFWDGANTTGNGVINGGTADWNNAASNWTNSAGAVNAPWQGGFAVFQGSGGTVSVSQNVSSSGMQFLVNGYTLSSGAFTITGSAPELVLRADAGVTAQIATTLTGDSKLIKRDGGTIVLEAVNTYTGGTRIEGGTLRLTNNNLALGTPGTVLEMDGGTIAFSGTLDLGRPVILDGAGGTFTPQTGAVVTLSQVVSGQGALNKTDAGTLALTADNTYTGGTTISSGFLRIGGGGTTGSVLGDILDNGTLVINRSNQIIIDGTISGSGAFIQRGSGTTQLNASNSYSGGTTLEAGILDAALDNRLGAASGDLTFDGGTLHTGAGFVSARLVTLTSNGGTLEDANGATFGGVISGSGGLTKTGAGTTILTADNTYTGGTTISAGTLQVGAAGTSGSLVGDIVNNGALLFNRSDASSFAGVISGSGEVSVFGGGTLTLTGANTYSGVNGTQVRGGSTLVVANNSNLGAATTGVLLRNSTLRLDGSFALTRNIVLEGAGGTNTVDTQANTVTVTGVISGETALDKEGSGTLILTNDNTYIDGTTIAAGTLQIGDGGTSGHIQGNVINNGALVFNRSDGIAFDGVFSGSGSLTQAGSGTLFLVNDHTYTGGTSINAGTLQLGDGGNSGRVAGNISNNSVLNFNRNDVYTYAGVISGSGIVNKIGSGRLTLGGANTFAGLTTVRNGSLLLTGSLAGAVQVNNGATFGGSGSVAGAVTVASGGILAPGTSPGTLTLGSLLLNASSVLDYELGLPDIVGGTINDLTVVNGNLTLDGNLNIHDAGGFGYGVYRLFNYSGTLTDNGLNFGLLPGVFTPGELLLQTSIASQVNLIVTQGGFDLQFWDGPNLVGNNSIDGGSSTWNATDSHWTGSDGAVNAPWQSGFAVFQGSAGTVTLAQNASFSGAQFRTDGYVITGSFALAGADETVLRVDPNVTATVAVNLVNGATPMRLLKTDLGTLVLTGSNTYSGGTTIRDGTLRINADSALGAASGGVLMEGATLAGGATLTSNRAFTLSGEGGAFAPISGTTLSLAGVLSGDGSLGKSDAGTLVLSGANTYQGGTRINAGVLGIRADNNLGASNGGLELAGGTLRLDASFTLPATRSMLLEAVGGRIDTQANTATVATAMHGDGGLTKLGSGRLILTGLNGYLGGTSIQAGSLQIGAGGTSGRVLGNIVDNGALIFARSDVLGYDGIISGSGNLVQQGPGRLVLTGDHTFTGGTTVSGGILQLGSTTATGSVLGNIVNNAGLIFARSDDTTYAGVVSGSGTLTQQGPGKLTLTGNNTYSGGTSVLTGVTLQVGTGGTSGALSGNIGNNGLLIFNRGDNITYAGNITGTGAFTQQGPGMLTLLGALNESGQTTVAAGALKVGNAGSVGSLSGDVLNNAALIFHRADRYTYAGVVSGSGSLEQRGPGTLVLTGNQTYTGGTLISGGTLQVGAGTTGRLSGNVVNQGHLLFARNDSIAYTGVVSGAGRLTQNGSGTLVLTGAHTYTGLTTVAGGTLQLDGSVAGAAQVDSGATLTGVGNVAGLLTVANGGHIAPGDSPGTLQVGGLLLNSGSILDYELGLPDVIGGSTNDLIEVAGDLTLDGTVNVSNVGGFGDGVYRLLNYGGGLTNNGLLVGTLPTGIAGSDVAVQTSIDQQVNLVVSRGGFALQFWDGADTVSDGSIDGGSAVWNNSQSHWTNVDGNANLSWQSGFAVFSVSPGTVTLGEDVSISGMQFSTGGYHVSGDGHQIGLDAAESIVRVYNRGEATVDAVLADGVNGPAKLILRDRGTLVLNGANSYSGGTLVDGGFLQIASNANLGAAGTQLELNGGTLITSASFGSDRALVLSKNHGVLSPNADTTLTWSGAITGAGGLNKVGAGTLVLTGDNRYAVGTFIGAGVLEVSRDANLGTASGGLMMGGGTLRWGADFAVGAARNLVLTAAGRFDTNGHDGSLNHVITGDGGLIKQGQGTLVLSADNVYAGNTQIDAGTLQIGNGGTTGNVLGDIQNNGTLAFARGNDVAFAGTVVGSGALVQRGAGTLTLSANQGYTGGTTIASGKLMLGQGGATGSVLGNIRNAGELIVNRSDNLLYEGVVSGGGALTKLQNNTLVLSADQTYTGLTTISAGQLRLGNGGATGNLAGDVRNNGELAFFHNNALNFAGAISGSGALRQLGSGVVTLSGSNTYSGGTFLDSGTVSVANDSALGAVSGGVSFDGGTLRLTASFDSDRVFHLAQGNGAIETVGTRNKLSRNIDGNGMLIKTGDGVLILNYGGSHTGGTQVRAGSLVVGDSAHPQAVLRNGAVGVAVGASLGGYGSIIGNVTNEGFIGVGNALPALASEPDAVFTIAGNLANRGTVSLLNGVAADRLVIKQGSFYTFGGLVQLETVLNGGDLNTQSDQLVVDGVRRGEGGGMTGLQINAVGGAGQVTDGDGIRVVDVTPDGVSEAGAFALVNRVVAGSHEYLLFHGGLSNPNDGDWYLRSESNESVAPLPILRPEIGGFIGNRFMAERLLVHTLHQRQGEPDPTLDSNDEERGPLWANVNGVEANTQTDDGLVQLRSNSWRLQTGVDLLRHRSDGGSVLRAGAFLQYGQANTDTQAVINPARADAQVTGYGLGVYATWFGNPETMLGAYVDGWWQYNRFDNEVDGSAGYHADYDATGWAASLEAGYAIALSKRIVLEPQLQYVRVNLDNDGVLDSSFTQIVDLTRSDWAARIGARLYGVPDKPGGFSPFVEVNWWRRAGNAAMQFNSDQVDHLVPKSLPTLDVGVQGNFGHGWNTWLRLGTDLSDERYQEISGSAGVRFQW